MHRKVIKMKEKSDIEILCENVKKLRIAKNMTKEEMAKKLKICLKTLERIEQGVLPKSITCAFIFRIYEKFGILPKDIFQPLKFE